MGAKIEGRASPPLREKVRKDKGPLVRTVQDEKQKRSSTMPRERFARRGPKYASVRMTR